jgi:hypothetical protein
MGYQQTQAELIEHLRAQLGFLERSAEAFDNGFQDEAKRLAVVIRVLLHDTPASQSVLGLLGVKQHLAFMDSANRIDPKNLVSTPGLVMFSVSADGPRYEAKLGRFKPPRGRRPNPPKRFDAWWNDPVTKDDEGHLFARRDYVLAVANKEGGAHVDPTLDAKWAALTRNDSLGFVQSPQGGIRVGLGPNKAEGASLGTPALVCIRQIAYELDESLRAGLTNILA